MKDSDFLNKLKKEGKLELIELSEEISKSYELKSRECRNVAKLTLDAGYYESSVTQAYYSMYNLVLSLFFKCGIKCENHSAALILLRDLFKLKSLSDVFGQAKEERIDKQYYVTPIQLNPASKDSAEEMLVKSNKFVLDILAFKNNLKQSEIKTIRENFSNL
jgi:uncharacterized protein (UPF0332 family)